MKTTLVLLACCIAALFVSCQKPSFSCDQSWTPRIKITESKDSLVGGIILSSWQNKIIALRPQSGVMNLFLHNSDNNSWAEVPLTGVPHGYTWSWPGFDMESDRVAFKQDYAEGNQLVMSVLVGRLTADGALSVREVTEKKWSTNTKALFGETYPDVRFDEYPRGRICPALGLRFILNGSELYLPYNLSGFTFSEKGVSIGRGPYVNGVLHSADLGKTWEIENLSAILSWNSKVAKTAGHYYYFAANLPSKPSLCDKGSELSFAQKPSQGKSWTTPQAVTKTYGDLYQVAAHAETVHLCWEDRRHGKKNLVFSLFPPGLGFVIHNGEIAYCNRKDADSKWGREIFLSKGLPDSFSSCMSVEGDHIVVAWAGTQVVDSRHGPYEPNDIYYVTSKDSGKTWTKPLKVTDGVKDGLTAGQPQVVLLNGVIHMTYIQGKMHLKQESPGLTKLNQPPWPIYYQQRPFPE